MRSLGPLLAGILLLAACTTPERSEQRGDRGADEPRRADCVVADPEGELIVHPGTLVPTTATELVDASLLEPVNLEVIEASVVAFSGNPSVHGIIHDYPPLKKAGIADSLADWDTRRPLAHLRLRRSDGQQAVLVALRLSDPAEAGHLKGVRVTSTTAGGSDHQDFPQPVLVEPHTGRCDVAAYDSTTEWTG